MKLFLSTVAALAMSLSLATVASAQSFEFEGSGGGDVEWAFDFEESATFTSTQGSNFTFNGGAGSNGDADAEGALAVTYGYSGQTAGGEGFSSTDTDMGTYAAANFASASFGESGALAADFAFGGPSEVSFGGLVTAGGAGSSGTGQSTGYNFVYGQNGEGSLTYSYGASQTQTP